MKQTVMAILMIVVLPVIVTSYVSREIVYLSNLAVIIIHDQLPTRSTIKRHYRQSFLFSVHNKQMSLNLPRNCHNISVDKQNINSIEIVGAVVLTVFILGVHSVRL